MGGRGEMRLPKSAFAVSVLCFLARSRVRRQFLLDGEAWGQKMGGCRSTVWKGGDRSHTPLIGQEAFVLEPARHAGAFIGRV